MGLSRGGWPVGLVEGRMGWAESYGSLFCKTLPSSHRHHEGKWLPRKSKGPDSWRVPSKGASSQRDERIPGTVRNVSQMRLTVHAKKNSNH